MALFTRGNLCTLCMLPMERRKEVIIFPHLVSNTHDPLFAFNNNAFHKVCVRKHPWGEMAVKQKQFVHETILPNTKRECVLCEEKVAEPTQLVGTGILTSSQKHPLFKFNWVEAHKGCITHWEELPVLVSELQKFASTGKWADFDPKFKSIEKLLAILSALKPGRAETAML